MTTEELEKLCREVLDAYPDKVNNYKLGKTALLGLFTGEVVNYPTPKGAGLVTSNN